MLVIFTLICSSCFKKSVELSESNPPDHSPFTILLQKHVNEKGMVNYQAFLKDRKSLSDYLESLTKSAPAKNWTEKEKLAFWINAYNAFTIALILEYYPVESIKDIGPKISIPFVNTPWQIDFIEIGSKKYNLDDIEHGIIRKEFDEPRIHFALVCAAVSCPKLRHEAYEAEKLDMQLQEQALDFLMDASKNNLNANPVQVSKIFQWYAADFKSNHASVLDYVNSLLPNPLPTNTKVEYAEYYWDLNEQKN